MPDSGGVVTVIFGGFNTQKIHFLGSKRCSSPAHFDRSAGWLFSLVAAVACNDERLSPAETEQRAGASWNF